MEVAPLFVESLSSLAASSVQYNLVCFDDAKMYDFGNNDRKVTGVVDA